MIRPTALMFLLIFSSVVLLAQHVDVEVRHPSSCRTGDRCIVDVLITKEDISGFARFQQILPEGVTAELVEDGGGEFIFERQRVAFIWLRLPEQDQVRVSYRLVFSSTVKGQFEITEGLFSYLQENRTQRHPIDPLPIALNEAPTPRAAVAASAAGAVAADTKKSHPQTVAQTPAAAEVAPEMPVTTTTPKPVETPVAKPAEIPVVKPAEAPVVKPAEVPTVKPAEAPAVKPAEVPAVKPAEAPVVKPAEEPLVKPAEVPVTKPAEVPAVKPAEIPVSKPTETPAAKPSGVAPSPSPATAQTGGMEYRVQVAALRTLRPVNSIQQQFGLKEEVFVETTDGWHRYTFGPFATHEAAETARKAFVAKNGGNAMVVSYKDGKRQ